MIVGLVVMMIMQRKPAVQQAYPPMPPYPYPPPRRRKRRRKKRPEKKEEVKIEKIVEPAPVVEEVPEVKEEPAFDDSRTENGLDADADADADNGDNLSLQDDPNVLKSEIDDIRKSIVSMSVGQPGRTSTIVKEWLEQPAPEAPTAVEEASSEDSGGEEESDE